MARVHELVFDGRYLRYGGGASFVAGLFIFKVIAPVCSSKLTSSYWSLKKHEQTEWNERILSNFNACLSIVLSVYCLFIEEGMRYEDVWHDSKAARLACALIVGYMLADIIIMVVWCRSAMTKGEMLGFIFHHLASTYAYYFISGYGVLCYFGMLRLIAEVSTPAMNQRWYFDVTGTKRSRRIVILNGLVMLVTFFFFRMVTMPIYWYQIWLVTNTEQVIKLGHIQLIMYIPCLVLDSLNILWFSKICKGFYKAVRVLVRGSKDKEMVAEESGGYDKRVD